MEFMAQFYHRSMNNYIKWTHRCIDILDNFTILFKDFRGINSVEFYTWWFTGVYFDTWILSNNTILGERERRQLYRYIVLNERWHGTMDIHKTRASSFKWGKISCVCKRLGLVYRSNFSGVLDKWLAIDYWK